MFICFRKTCKNCKCSRDGHEIIAEHGARSRVGFAATLDGLDARSLGYTFAPPGLTSARQVNLKHTNLFLYESNLILMFYVVQNSNVFF